MAEGAKSTETTREVDWSAFESLWRPGDQTSAPPRLRAVSTVIAAILWLVSIVLVIVAWSEVADRTNVADQLPWVVSGAFMGVVLSIIGGAIYLGGGPTIGRRKSGPGSDA